MSTLSGKKLAGSKKQNGAIQYNEMDLPSSNLFHSPSHDFTTPLRKKSSKKKSKSAVKDKKLDMYNKIEITSPQARVIPQNAQDMPTRDTLPSNSTESPETERHQKSVRGSGSDLNEIGDSAYSRPSKTADSHPAKYGSEGGSQASSQTFSNSNSIEDNHTTISHSSSTPISLPSDRSPPLACVSTLPPHSALSRSFSVSLRSSTDPNSRRKRGALFARRNNTINSSSSSSLRSASTSSMMEVKSPSPPRFLMMYHAVRKGVSEHISVNTAELNVIQVKQRGNGLNAAQSYGADKQIKHLERVIKKLQYLQSQFDELHEAYTLQQRYREGAFKLKSALSSSRVSSRSSMLGIKSDLTKCSESLCTIEQELTALLGRFHIQMKGLLGFARLRSGDHYEVTVRYGNQKWKMKGLVKSAFDQTWDSMESTMQPLLTELIHIKVTEVKILGKHSLVGNVSCETKDLFKVDPQNLLVDLNDLATLKLSLQITWSPFDGYEVSNNPGTSSSASSNSRIRSRSVIERPSSSLAPPRNRISQAFSRPLSVIYSSANSNNNNSNHRPITAQTSLDGPIRISQPLNVEETSSMDENSNKRAINKDLHDDDVFGSHSKEEEAFLAAISRNVKRALDGDDELQLPPPGESPIEDIKPLKPVSAHARRTSKLLITTATNLNFMLDDYRGRYAQLRHLEDVVTTLLTNLKKNHRNEVKTDGFRVVSSDEDESDSHAETSIFTTGRIVADEALIPHLELCQCLLKDVGKFGPLKVKEIIAFDKLNRQSDVIKRLMEIGMSCDELLIEELEELEDRRGMFEMWRSCCDGGVSLCVSVRTLRLELMSEHGRGVRVKHSDVADQVFPELVRRIYGRYDITDIETKTVTLFHLIDYVNEASDSVHEDFAKLVDKLALEMFITSTLTSGVDDLVLVAIKRLSSLLALRMSNLRALSHLLLDSSSTIRSSAAAHIKHISTEEPLKEKAMVSYAELLESPHKKDRQCACIALGFLGVKRCIPQLGYLYSCDPERDVREAASNVLKSLGEEGEQARDHASSTLLVQTMTQQVSLTNHARMGTAL